MKKGLIIALAVVLVLGLSGVAMAWHVSDTGYVDDFGGGWATTIDYKAGGAEGCFDPADCETCPWMLDTFLSGQAGIVDVHGWGRTQIIGNGTDDSVGPVTGQMSTEVWGPLTSPLGPRQVAAERLFINDTVDVQFCEPCCEIDRYRATTSVNVEDGQAYIYDQQVAGLPSISGVVSPDPVTEQVLQTYGTAGDDISDPPDGYSLVIKMDAAQWKKDCMTCQTNFVDDWTMEIRADGGNTVPIDFDVYAYQGIAEECSNVYGALGTVENVWVGEPVCDWVDVLFPVLSYGKFETNPECPTCVPNP